MNLGNNVSCGFDATEILWMTYVLDQSTLMLERVTLAQMVQLVVKVLVDLA